MNSTIQQHGAGNGVVFLIAAIYNMLLAITSEALAEYALFALVSNMIGWGTWLFFKKLGDRLDRARRAKVRLGLKKKRAQRDNQ